MHEMPRTRPSLLMRLQGERDEGAWTEFLRIYEPLVLRLMRRRGLQESDARDATQQVLLRISGAIERYVPDGAEASFRRWLSCVARNVVISFLTRRSQLPTAMGDEQIEALIESTQETSPESDMFDDEYRQQILAWAIEQVRLESRAATWQAFLETSINGRPIAEVAEELQMSPGSKATEAEVNAVAEEHKRTSESLVTAEALIESYRTASEAYEDIHTSDAEVPTCQEPIHNARTDLGHDPDVALAWLEAATGLKLEFIRFDDLKLWFKAALRVREASGKHQAGDLIVTLNEHRFDSLDQATEALSRKSRGNFKTIVLRGGLAGHREQAHFNGEPLSGYLRPGDPVEKPNGNAATIPFEVRIRGEAASGLRTAYLLGTCVAPDGLVVIPVLSKSLVPGEPLIPYGKIKGTARVVATDDAHGLTLVKLDSPNQPLFHWWKCHMGSPAKQQRLNCQDENGKPYDVLVSEIGQPLTKPLVGNDAFIVTGPSVWSFTPGLALKTVDQELQGITIPAELAPVERKPQDDDPGNRKLAIPAVHIEKMIKDYRKASRKSAEGAAVKLNEPQPTSF